MTIASRRGLAAALLVPFSLLTLYALRVDGLAGIFAAVLERPGGWQVLADLVVALVLVLVWLVGDARRSGRSAWPWVLLTLALGSFGPLLYLVTDSAPTGPPHDDRRDA